MLRSSLLLVLVFGLAIPALAQSVVEIQASKDNTLYEDPDGILSNGAGQHLFAGKTARAEIRRALVAFDLNGAITGGFVIDSVQVQLHMNKSLGSRHIMTLHRVTRDWGEGSSDPVGEEGGGTTPSAGDATWIDAMTPTVRWTTQGGDFASTASASRSVQATGAVVWYSSTELVNDVSQWLNAPSENFGWLVRGNEAANSSAMRFSSRQNPTVSERPVLRIYYRSVATHAEREDLPEHLALTAAWPNPFTSRTTLSITSNRAEQASVEVVDVHGRTVERTQQQLRAGSNDLWLDGSDWAPGVYWVRVQTQTGTLTRSVVRLR